MMTTTKAERSGIFAACSAGVGVWTVRGLAAEQAA
jgi:hypothetical protein